MGHIEQLEKDLISWESSDFPNGIMDAIDDYFNSKGDFHWTDIAEDAFRLNKLMFDEAPEHFSPVYSLWWCAIARSQTGAEEAMAAMLGVNPKYLSLILSNWSEGEGRNSNTPPPLTGQQLVDLCLAEEKWDNEKHEEDELPPFEKFMTSRINQ